MGVLGNRNSTERILYAVFFHLNSEQRYLKFPKYIPSPFDGGGRGWVDKRNRFPPPLHPLPPGEGRFLGVFSEC